MGAKNTKIEKVCPCGTKFMSMRWGNLGLCPGCVERHLRDISKKRNQSRDKNGNWRGGRTRNSRGYVLFHMPEHPRSHNGYVLEHIVVVEEKIGRRLLPDETVHHLNGQKTDNRPENLVTVDRSLHAHIHKGWKKPRVLKPKRTPKNKGLELSRPRGTDQYTWPADDVLLEMSSRMSTRVIAGELGGVSNVAVWKRLKKISAS